MSKKKHPNLESRSRYCKHCQDKYWNSIDCGSIREHRMCYFCRKESILKEHESLLAK